MNTIVQTLASIPMAITQQTPGPAGDGIAFGLAFDAAAVPLDAPVTFPRTAGPKEVEVTPEDRAADTPSATAALPLVPLVSVIEAPVKDKTDQGAAGAVAGDKVVSVRSAPLAEAAPLYDAIPDPIRLSGWGAGAPSDRLGAAGALFVAGQEADRPQSDPEAAIPGPILRSDPKRSSEMVQSLNEVVAGKLGPAVANQLDPSVGVESKQTRPQNPKDLIYSVQTALPVSPDAGRPKTDFESSGLVRPVPVPPAAGQALPPERITRPETGIPLISVPAMRPEAGIPPIPVPGARPEAGIAPIPVPVTRPEAGIPPVSMPVARPETGNHPKPVRETRPEIGVAQPGAAQPGLAGLPWASGVGIPPFLQAQIEAPPANGPVAPQSWQGAIPALWALFDKNPSVAATDPASQPDATQLAGVIKADALQAQFLSAVDAGRILAASPVGPSPIFTGVTDLSGFSGLASQMLAAKAAQAAPDAAIAGPEWVVAVAASKFALTKTPSSPAVALVADSGGPQSTSLWSDLAADPGQLTGIGALPGASFTTASGVSPGLPLGTPVLSHTAIIGQIAGLLQRPLGSVTEVALSPAELGHVKMSFRRSASDPERLVLAIMFERPEVMDLFRRNADQLLSDLRSSGYTGVDLSFGRFGNGGQEERAPPPPESAAAPGRDDGEQPAPHPAAMNRPLLSSASLDLRL